MAVDDMATDHRLLQCDISIQNLPPSCTTWSQSDPGPTRSSQLYHPGPKSSQSNMRLLEAASDAKHIKTQLVLSAPPSYETLQTSDYPPAASPHASKHKAEHILLHTAHVKRNIMKHSYYPAVISSKTNVNIISVVPSKTVCFSAHQRAVSSKAKGGASLRSAHSCRHEL